MLLTEQKLEFVVCSVAAATWPAARVREEASSPQSSPCRWLQHVTSDQDYFLEIVIVKEIITIPVTDWQSGTGIFQARTGNDNPRPSTITYKFVGLLHILHRKFLFSIRCYTT